MKHYQQLEQRWALFNDLDPAGMVVCSSGTAALHLALECFELPPESGVIVPDYTMIAVPRAVTLAGHIPVPVDCGDDLLMDEQRAGERYERGYTRAAVFVHVYGRKCPMDRFARAAVHNVPHPGLLIIEDLAEAHGVRPHPQTDAACWSFYANKIVAGEEGGAVWFHDPARAELARSLRTLGFTAAHDYRHVPRGHNYRLADCLADKVMRSLSCYGGNLAARRIYEAAYEAKCPGEWKMPWRDAPWVYDLRIPGMNYETKAKVVAGLNGNGIAARHGFVPVSLQEEYRGLRWEKCENRSESKAEVAGREVIYLPLTPGIVEPWHYGRAFEIIREVVG